MRLMIISGGSRGLGDALCRIYLDRGYRLVEFSRSAPHKYSVKIDMAAPVSALQVVAETLNKLAQSHWEEVLVINNAATVDPIGSPSQKDAHAVLDNMHTNICSAVLFMSEAMRCFQSLAAPKSLVNISSGAALGGFPGWALYCTAKAGLENFINTIAMEQNAEPHPFRAINVDPGLIDTDMQAAIRTARVEDFPAVDRFIQSKEAGVLVAPHKVAEKVARLIDDVQVSNGQRVSV